MTPVQSLLNSIGVFEKDSLSCNNKMEICFRGEKKKGDGVLISRINSRASWILLLRAFIALGFVGTYCLAQLSPAQAKLLKSCKSDPSVCKIWIPSMQIKSKQKITGNLEAQTEKESLSFQKGRLALIRKC